MAPRALDLDDKGNTKFFGQVVSLDAPKALDGTPLPPAQLVTVKGLVKGKELNPAFGGGRGLLTFSIGEINLPRASVRMLLHGNRD